MSFSSLSQRDRRALVLLGVAVGLFALLQMDFLFPASIGGPSASASIEAVEEKLLLARVRARQAPLADAEMEAAAKLHQAMEKRLLSAKTAALAQAEMREIVGNLLAGEGITLQGSQFGAVQLEGEHYAQVPLSVAFNCGIEKFVNLMAAIANAKPLLSTRRIRISPDGGKTKGIRVQLVVSGYLPASRTPELVKKSSAGGAAF